MLVFMFTLGALEDFLAIFASNEGLPSGSLYFVIMSVSLLAACVTLGKVVDERGEALFVYTGNAAMLAALLLLALSPNVVTFVISAALAGCTFGGLEPALQSMAVHTATDEKRGSANSTFLCGCDIGYGLGGGAAGVLITSVGHGVMWAIVSLAWPRSCSMCRGRAAPTRASPSRLRCEGRGMRSGPSGNAGAPCSRLCGRKSRRAAIKTTELSIFPAQRNVIFCQSRVLVICGRTKQRWRDAGSRLPRSSDSLPRPRRCARDVLLVGGRASSCAQVY